MERDTGAARESRVQPSATRETETALEEPAEPRACESRGDVSGALDADAIVKKGSILVDLIGQKVAADIVNIIDDGLMPKGLGSSPFDGEGVPTSRKEIISGGTLKSYLFDTYTGRKARTHSTGNARREHSSLPSIGPFNFYLQRGSASFDDIIGSVKSGLYLTNLMGFGSNAVTGDFSLGGAGLWIENGKLSYPVEDHSRLLLSVPEGAVRQEYLTVGTQCFPRCLVEWTRPCPSPCIIRQHACPPCFDCEYFFLVLKSWQASYEIPWSPRSSKYGFYVAVSSAQALRSRAQPRTHSRSLLAVLLYALRACR